MFNQWETTPQNPVVYIMTTPQEDQVSKMRHPEYLIRQCRVPYSMFGASQKPSSKQLMIHSTELGAMNTKRGQSREVE